MLRTFGLVAIALCAATAALSAQFGELPECDGQSVERALAVGRVPSIRGCTVSYAIDRISATFGQRYRVNVQQLGGPPGAKPITIVRQAQNGELIHLYAIASQSPPAPQPPQPANVQPPPIVQPPLSSPSPPPPPTPEGPAEVITAVASGAAVNPSPSTGEIYRNVIFSILDAAPVEAGKTLVFVVRREGHDGQAHQVNFRYSGGGLTIDPPPSMRFEPGDPSQKNLQVQTAAAQPGDGENRVHILLSSNDDGAFIGVPRSASGLITEAVPPASPVTYRIAADGPFSRGKDLRFTVTRTGPLEPVQLPFRIVQGGASSAPDGSPDEVRFAEGQASAPLIVPASRYSVCGGEVTVVLDGGAVAGARFPEPPPPNQCGGPLPPPPWWIEYLPLLLGGVALGTALMLDSIFKPFMTVHPSCTITPGALAFRPLEQPVSRWPEFGASVAMEPGDLQVTQPLPRSEPADG